MELEVHRWVEKSPSNQRLFRKAVHIVLNAIATSDHLKPHMIMKGGMLLGIRYKSSRYTKDIDFSTSSLFADFNIDEFKENFNNALLSSSEELAYGIDCNIQSINVQPRQKPNVTYTFPSLKIKIGYAAKGSPQHKRFLDGNSSHTVEIDYSFNETVPQPEELKLGVGEIIAYGYLDLIAEKLRSVMQQAIRHRSRRQDIYDLNYLLDNSEELNDEEKYLVLQSILIKSKGRLDDNQVNQSALDNEEIYELAKADYPSISDEVEGVVPDFDESYQRVNEFYKSLPWNYM